MVTQLPECPGWKEGHLVQPPAQNNSAPNTRSGQSWLRLVRT